MPPQKQSNLLCGFFLADLDYLLAFVVTTITTNSMRQPLIATVGTFDQLGRGQKVVCAFAALLTMTPFLLR